MAIRWTCNGLDGTTGAYRRPPLGSAELAAHALGLPVDQDPELAARVDALADNHLGPIYGVDPLDLAQCGWGVVFAAGDPRRADRERALAPLLEHRRAVAGRKRREFFRTFEYQPGESPGRFRDRIGADHGSPDPEKVPFYLLIAAEPELIPWSVQADLDVEYAVGRLALADAAAEAAYVEALVRQERTAPPAARRACVFATRREDDDTTRQSHDFLAEPLAALMAAEVAARDLPWRIDSRLGDAASKLALGELLGGVERPSLLFAASHGVSYRLGDRAQEHRQGAVVCQDWPGPTAWTSPSLPREFTYAADDLDPGVRLDGLVFVHFACFSAGTPRRSHYGRREEIAGREFAAALPSRLLAQGALGVIGHVDEAWGHSYLALEGGDRLESFRSLLLGLLDGQSLGMALESINHRHASLGNRLRMEREQVVEGGARVETDSLAGLYIAHQDARGYVLLGDPAARLKPGTR